MANPLDNFKSSTVTTNDFHLPKMPALLPLVKELGLMAGVARFDLLLEDWRQNFEKQIIDKLAAKVSQS